MKFTQMKFALGENPLYMKGDKIGAVEINQKSRAFIYRTRRPVETGERSKRERA